MPGGCRFQGRTELWKTESDKNGSNIGFFAVIAPDFTLRPVNTIRFPRKQ